MSVTTPDHQSSDGYNEVSFIICMCVDCGACLCPCICPCICYYVRVIVCWCSTTHKCVIFHASYNISATFLYGVVKWDGVKFGGGYVYPAWAEGLGWILCLSSMVCMPVGAVYTVLKIYNINNYSINYNEWSLRTVSSFI